MGNILTKVVVTAKEELDKAINKLNGIADDNKRLIEENKVAKQVDLDELSSQMDTMASKHEVDLERKRIDSFTSLEQGSTTGDAELIDGRVGENGVTYNNIGNAIREQFKNLNITYNYQFIDYLNKTDGIYYDVTRDSQSKVVIIEHENASYSKLNPIKLKAGKYYFSNLLGYFSIIIPNVETPESGEYKRLNSIWTIEGSDGGSNGYFTVNYDCTLYPSCFKNISNPNTPYVVLCNNEELPSTYVCGAYNLLYDGVDLKNINVDVDISYEDLTDKNGAVNLFSKFYGFNTELINDNSVNVTANMQGLVTNEFLANTNNLTLKVEGSFTCEKTSILLMYHNGTDWQYQGQLENITGGVLNHTVVVDASNYAVYHGATKFKFLVMSASTSVGTITIDKISVNDLDEFRANEMYDVNFIDMTKKTFNRINNNVSQINRLDLKIPTLCDANGNKYSLAVGTDGTLKTISNIPTKVAVRGNSLVAGMGGSNKGGSFGMCATDSTKDFYTHVKNAILSKNSEATFNRDSIAIFEQAENIQSANSEITRHLNLFDADLDLIIIQIGDNVNTDLRRSTFTTSFPSFISQVKAKCIKARIICVGVWYTGTADTNKPKDTIINTCKKYGCEFVDISYLHTPENEATIGDIITYIDGSTETVPSIWATHPGNTGMKAIADAIISAINM